METLDALDAIEDLSDADELKNKLLFSVVVVSTLVLHPTHNRIRSRFRWAFKHELLNLKELKNFLPIPSFVLKFMFSKKATKIDEIFTVDLTQCSKRQIYGEDFVNFRGLIRKYELY